MYSMWIQFIIFGYIQCPSQGGIQIPLLGLYLFFKLKDLLWHVMPIINILSVTGSL